MYYDLYFDTTGSSSEVVTTAIEVSRFEYCVITVASSSKMVIITSSSLLISLSQLSVILLVAIYFSLDTIVRRSRAIDKTIVRCHLNNTT